MTQAYIEQEIEEQEIEEQEIEEQEIEEQEIEEQEQKANEKIVANPSGISNPRYFENARTPKKAKIAYDLNRI